jgi:hypothetical protein
MRTCPILKMRLMRYLTCRRFILSLILCVSGLAESGHLSKTFRSERYGYVVRYPSSWYLHAPLGTLEIENFPPSRTERGSGLPKGGAAITLLPCQAVYQRAKIQTLDDCIALDHRSITPPPGDPHFVKPDNVSGKRGFDLTLASGKVSILEVSGTCCAAVPPFKEYVDWYFEAGGKVFRASVEYWKGEPKAGKLLGMMQEIVLSLKLSSNPQDAGQGAAKY